MQFPETPQEEIDAVRRMLVFAIKAIERRVDKRDRQAIRDSAAVLFNEIRKARVIEK